jgi:CheY-like chemotaxis protein
MKGYVVLLADNKAESLQVWSTSLRDAGYEVKSAASPQEARRLLQDTAVDLAVLDVRLHDDDDPNDSSGIQLASDRAFRHIPKIMLTGIVVSYGAMQDALGFNKPDELPPAVTFVNKAEGPEKLLQVIDAALERWPKLRISTSKVSEQTKIDYELARHQAELNYRVALAVSIIGFLVIFAGICLAWSGRITIGIVSTTTGLLTEALSYLFFRRVDLANNRVDIYHRELLESYWLELLIGTCQQLPAEKRISGTEKAIHSAIDRWITPASASKVPSRAKKKIMPEG